MKKLIKGLTYAYNRNIGWQDRTIRTILGIAAIVGTFYFINTNMTLAAILGVFAFAQLGTALSARCIMCFFAGKCTITYKEKQSLESKGVKYEII